MAWAFVGVSSVVSVTATSHALTEPAGVLPGDLLIAVISSRIASTTSITLPSGWTLVAESKTNNVVAAATTSEASGMMAYIVRGASAPNLTFTHPTAPSVALGRIVAYRGQKATSPFDVGIGAKTGTNVTAVSTTGLTTAEADELIVKGVCSGRASAFSAHDAATDPTTGSGTGSVDTAAPTVGTWRERQDSSTTTGADTALAIADAIRGTAGATGALTCTASVAGGHAQVAGAFKMEPVFPFGSNNTTSGTTVNVTIPATASGDCIIVAGKLAGPTATITAGGQSVQWATLGGLTSPRRSPRGFWLFAGIITNPTVGTTTVALTADTSGNNEIGAWVVSGLTSPVQDKGVLATYQINDNTMSGPTGALTNASAFAAAYHSSQGGTLALDTSQSYSSGFVSDALNTASLGSGFSHQITSATTQIQAAWNASGSGGGDDLLVVYRSTPPAAPSAPAVSLIDFEQRELWDFAVELWPYFSKTTQAGDCIIVAGQIESTDTTGFAVTTNNGDTYTPGTLGGVTTPVVFNGKSFFVGIIKNPTVGTYAVSLTTNTSQRKGIAAWIVRGLTTPEQDKGVWATGDAGPVVESGLTGTLAAADEFAIGYGSDPHTHSINVDATGSSGFLLDTFVTNLDSGWSHQITTTTGSIQAAFDANAGANAVFVATFKSGGVASVTGTLDATDTADTAAFTGTVEWRGTLDATDTADTAAFTGSVAWLGTLDATDSPDTAAFTGSVEWQAVLDVTDSPDTAAFTGVVEWQAVLDATDSPDVADFTGIVLIELTGVLDVTDLPDTAAFTGETITYIVLDATDSPDTMAFTGVVLDPVTGILDATEVADTASFISDVATVGILDVTDSPDIAAFTGQVISSGTLTVTDAADTADFTGSVTVATPFTQVIFIG